ncbi:MAG: rebM 1 [Thermoleophilia bacterium]|nr:rebM 1 [Thermoleophilia bacterium]
MMGTFLGGVDEIATGSLNLFFPVPSCERKARGVHDAPPSDRTERRFDGPYGRAYDAAVTSPVVRRGFDLVSGGTSTLANLDDLARRAYAAAPDEALLDIPCGAFASLELAKWVPRTGRVVGADLSAGMLRAAEARRVRLAPAYPVELVRADATKLPFDDDEFGAVLSINGLHCMPDAAAVLAEVARVLRPGGAFVLSTFVDVGGVLGRVAFRAYRWAGVLPVPPPSHAEFARMLDAAGFDVEERLSGRTLVALACRRRGTGGH